MAHLFYYDKNGKKVGPLTMEVLKALAEQGTIMPETRIENHKGRSALAVELKALTFPNSPTRPLIESAEQSALPTVSDVSPYSPYTAMLPTTPHGDDDGIYGIHIETPATQRPEEFFLPLSTVKEVKASSPPLLSRAVFIFLAVFVGIFGIHDF